MGAKLEINQDLLTAAEQIASRRGQSLSAFIEQVLRDARVRSPDGRTVRELEILKLIAEGLSHQAIADRLSLSLRTVRTYARKIDGQLKAKRLKRPRYGSRRREQVELPTFRGQGLQPGVNLDDSVSLLELMEPSHAPD